MSLTVVSIGPGDSSLLNKRTESILLKAEMLWLRTGMHPLASWLKQSNITFRSMDDLYNSSEDFEILSETAARILWSAATKENVVYAVSDQMTDHTVDAVFKLRPENADIRIIPGFSFADYYLPSCRDYFSTSDIRICSAASFVASGYDPSIPVLITEINDEITAGEIKQLISSNICDEEKIVFMNGDAHSISIPVYELDRQPHYDHLSAVGAGAFPYAARCRKTLPDLMRIMDHLRSPSGCPWDRIQTHDSLKPYVVEEAWEVVDAIQEKDPDHLAEELGDLLFQVAFHASIGKSFDEFSIDDIIGKICEKMVRRHPHVFLENGECAVSGSSVPYSSISWDRIKQKEKGERSPDDQLDDISAAIPSLRYAEKILRKMNLVRSFEYPSESEILSLMDEIFLRIKDTSDRQATEIRIGTLLLCISEYSRQLNMDSEILLHQAVRHLITAYRKNNPESKKEPGIRKPLTFKDLCVY